MNVGISIRNLSLYFPYYFSCFCRFTIEIFIISSMEVILALLASGVCALCFVIAEKYDINRVGLIRKIYIVLVFIGLLLKYLIFRMKGSPEALILYDDASGMVVYVAIFVLITGLVRRGCVSKDE